MIEIPSVADMDDETLMKHMELRHEGDLAMSFEIEPGRDERRLRAPKEWRTYHDTIHRLALREFEHQHTD